MSFAQQRLWFIAQLEGPSAVYNNPLAVRLEGDLDAAALEAALADVIARHEVLRTVFPAADGQPYQRVLGIGEAGLGAAGDRRWPRRTWPGGGADRRRSRSTWPRVPVRARLLAAGPGVHVLVVVIHHIATDGWSAGILARDLSAAYAARRQGRAPGWAPLPVQYADYAIWQRELLGDADDPGSLLAQQVAWWRRGAGRGAAGAGAARRPAAPGGGQPPRARGAAGGPRGVHAAAGRAGPGAGRDVVHGGPGRAGGAAVQAGRGEDIPVGTAVAGRTDEALDDLVGFFVNTLVLRTDVSGDPSFTELLGRVREFWLGALEHQDVPFERLVEDLAPDRSLARHPLFQVMVTVQNNARGARRRGCPGCAAAAGAGRDRRRPGSTWSISLARGAGADGAPGGLRGQLMAAADLFDAGTARAIAGRLARVLAAVAADPEVRLRQVEVLDAAERAQVVTGWNDTAAPVPAGIGAGADRGAGGAGPGCGGGGAVGTCSVSYGELVARAGRLARLLAAAGGGAGAGGGAVPGPRPGDGDRDRWGCGWRGRRTCRWIRATRRRGWRSCWPTAGPGWWSPRRRLPCAGLAVPVEPLVGGWTWDRRREWPPGRRSLPGGCRGAGSWRT